MRIRYVDKCLVVTTKTKPVKGDLMCCLQVGWTIKSTGEVVIPRKRYLSLFGDTNGDKLNAICHGTEKVIIVLFGKFKKD